MQCEMCGREGSLIKAKIEGTEMDVCEKCSIFGKILGNINREQSSSKTGEVGKKINIAIIRKDYGKIIKKQRELLGLKQEELAGILKIKESVIHKIESELTEPSLKLAKQFEKFFNITLTEAYKKEREINSGATEIKEMTIGDLFKEKIK